MIAAEQWYEHQVKYQKYGLDMKPAQPRVREEKPQAILAGFSGKDKLRVLFLTVFLGVLFVGFITATAYSAKVQYDINQLNKQAAVTQGEIENLNVKLKSASNIQQIEEKAISRLGMMYPEMSRVVFIENEAEPAEDFALALKQQAYN